MLPIYPNFGLLTHELLTVKDVKVGFSIKKKKAARDTCISVAEMEVSEYTHS